MKSTAMEKWHDLVRNRDIAGLDAILADDATFYSPVVHTPQAGKEIARMYLSAAAEILFGGDFQYVREWYGEKDAVLEFQLEIDGVVINGVDIITWNDDEQIVDFKVMIRPWKAIELLRDRMLQAMQAHGA